MNNKKKVILNHFINVFLILLGCFIMGSAYNIFYRPHDIVLGGFGGIANIIGYLLSLIGVNLSISIIYIIMNIILFAFALKLLGKKFGIYALFGIFGYALFLEVCKFMPSLSDDLLLCSIYGGVMSGIGTGIVIRAGGSTGGGDMLGCVINHKNPKISVGWVTICVNIFVVALSMIIYGLNLSLYALIAIYIGGKIADVLIEGPKSIKAFYIISPKCDEICEQLNTQLKRGATKIEGYGSYTHKHLEVILSLVSTYQVRQLKEIVYNIDPNAFMFSVSVKEALGKGFHKLESKKKMLFTNEKVKLPNTLPQSQNFTLSPTEQQTVEQEIIDTKENIIITNEDNQENNKKDN